MKKHYSSLYYLTLFLSSISKNVANLPLKFLLKTPSIVSGEIISFSFDRKMMYNTFNMQLRTILIYQIMFLQHSFDFVIKLLRIEL